MLQHEKTQIMTTIVWLRQEWHDPMLTWKPDLYGGLDRIYVPSEMIWTPDIVLYNKSVFHLPTRRHLCEVAVPTVTITLLLRPKQR